MSGLEVNKILAAIIMALLIMAVISFVGDLIINVNGDKKETAYKIEVPEADSEHSVTTNKLSITESISPLLMNASLEKGEKLFKKCGSCHNYKKEGANKVGPNLWNIVNRTIASSEGFAYSTALSTLSGEWTYEDRLHLYKNVPQYGLATSFKNGKVLDIAKLLLKISQRGLKNRKFLSKSGYDERKYLENIEINLEKNLSPADMLIDKYYHQWGKSIKPIYEENIF